MGGQLIIFLPDYELICVTTADTQSIQGGNQQIYDALYEELLPHIQEQTHTPDETAKNALGKALSSLALKPLESSLPKNLHAGSGRTYYVQNEASDFQSFNVLLAENAGTLSFTYKIHPAAFRSALVVCRQALFPFTTCGTPQAVHGFLTALCSSGHTSLTHMSARCSSSCLFRMTA